MFFSIAFIPLAPKAKLSSAAVRADLAASWPDFSAVESRKAEKGQMAFRAGGVNIILALMPAPIPWSDLEGPCQTSWCWPDAEAALRGHAGHLIVTLLLDRADPVERSRLLTQACASVLASCEQALGVFWSDSLQVIPSKVFLDVARTLLPGPALPVWVDFRILPAGQGRTKGFTYGLAALGHMEFVAEDTPESPDGLRDRLLGLAHYVLENGPVIKDGDTIGEDMNERIRVVYCKSAFGHKDKVMRLEYSSAKSRKGWFGR